jgi:hypothetical protein
LFGAFSDRDFIAVLYFCEIGILITACFIHSCANFGVSDALLP